MVDTPRDYIFFENLETKLNQYRGNKILVEISNLDPVLLEDSDVFSESKIISKEDNIKLEMELTLEGVIKKSPNVGLAIVGRSQMYYWVIGTHTIHGYISKISQIGGDTRKEIYGGYVLKQRPVPSLGIAPKEIKEYREEIEWQKDEDPPNPFLHDTRYIYHLMFTHHQGTHIQTNPNSLISSN